MTEAWSTLTAPGAEKRMPRGRIDTFPRCYRLIPHRNHNRAAEVLSIAGTGPGSSMDHRLLLTTLTTAYPARLGAREEIPRGEPSAELEPGLTKDFTRPCHLLELTSVRIIHVSDLHASVADRKNQRLLIDELLADIARLPGPKTVDLMVFSGDLAFAGRTEDLELGRDLLLRRLQAQLNLDCDRFILAPGNHDVNISLINRIYEHGLDDMLVNSDAVDQLLDNEGDRAPAIARLQDWFEFFADFYNQGTTPPVTLPTLGHAYQYEIDGITVGAVSLNSAWRATGRPGNADKTRLLVGHRQLTDALQYIDRADVRLIVVHHPLDWLHDFDAVELEQTCERYGAIVLSGHEHQDNPVGVTSPRGAAIYGRAGSLYDNRHYRNGYSVIDIHEPQREVVIRLRRWWPERGEFDSATDIVHEGLVRYPLPQPRTSSGHTVIARSSVTRQLAAVAEEGSVIAERLGNHGEATIEDLLVEPCFYDVAYGQAVARSALSDEEDKPQRAYPLEMLERSRVVLINGEPESGVTSSLLWLLDKRHQSDAERLPLYVRYDKRHGKDPVGGLVREALQAAGARGSEAPPLIVAIDDINARSEAALRHLAQNIRDNKDSLYLVGSHGADQDAIARVLDAEGLTYERAFVGPFGRRELKQLIKKLPVSVGPDAVDKILSIIGRERLPRTPFVMAAFAAVLAEGAEAGLPNVTAVLDSYVNLLLGSLEAGTRDNVKMDFRRREHVLAFFAAHLVRSGESALPRVPAERKFGDYFSERGLHAMSAGGVMNMLIDRRILVEGPNGVGFRHAAIEKLFAAKWMLDQHDFSEDMLADCLRNADVIRHAVALKRSGRELLERVGVSSMEVLGGVARRLPREVLENSLEFEAPRERPDFDRLREDLKASREIWSTTDDRLDHAYDRGFGLGLEVDPNELSPRDFTISLMWRAVRLLSYVVSSSDLVDDIPLKQELFEEAVSGWGELIALLNAAEEDSGILRRVQEAAFGAPESDDADVAQRQLIRFGIVLSVLGEIVSTLGSSGLSGRLEAAMDKAEFMAVAPNAFFVTLVACLTEAKGWPRRLVRLDELHGSLWLVGTFTYRLAVVMYQNVQGLSTSDQTVLESFLASRIMEENAVPSGRAADVARSRIIAELRKDRRRAQSAGASSARMALLDPQDQAEGEPEDDTN